MAHQQSPQRPAPDVVPLVGCLVRVVARRGYTIEGICLDAWQLRNGGTALKVKPSDGSCPREVTTLLPVVVLRARGGNTG